MASGPPTDVDGHSSVKAGEATVLAAIGAQARVLTKVRVLRADGSTVAPSGGALPSVHFDRLPLSGGESISLTAGALGSAVLPIPHLEMGAPLVTVRVFAGAARRRVGGDGATPRDRAPNSPLCQHAPSCPLTHLSPAAGGHSGVTDSQARRRRRALHRASGANAHAHGRRVDGYCERGDDDGGSGGAGSGQAGCRRKAGTGSTGTRARARAGSGGGARQKAVGSCGCGEGARACTCTRRP